jgi:hypothetical protein
VRTTPEDALLQQDDPQPGLAQEIGAPAADRSTAHDHGVGGIQVASGGHWHEADAGID